ncbi:hypothetical protein A0H81_03250 [Grifola frondosa]|uniref:MYND-type domain-containing protein n=1 Tax=Grifola frondosa TaxID=5627 RepID=A0A1C7MHJ9_GRIFR|nr:hypothetical protein A0H81_03250 [Grifola frondosa]
MLGLRSDILQNATFSPRPHLEGINIPSTFKLPSLESVRTDSARRIELENAGGPGSISFLSALKTKDNAVDVDKGGPVPEPLAWNTLLPNLFNFSYFVRVEDVPEDLLKDVVFALSMFLRILQECSEAHLRAFGHYLPGQSAEQANAFMLNNARFKLARHLLYVLQSISYTLAQIVNKEDPQIDRPADAIPCLKGVIALNVKQLRAVGISHKPWLHSPDLYGMYGDALVGAGHFDLDTKQALERALEAATEGPPNAQNLTSVVVHARTHLALVLFQLGIEPLAQKEHTEWATKFFRKNPKLLPVPQMILLIARPGHPQHPVMEALGPKWLKDLENRRSTQRQDERRSQQCRNCNGMEPDKTLFRCAGCKHIYYCSRECQKANWKLHKVMCKETARDKERVDELKKTDPINAQRAADWIKWRECTNSAETFALVHALGLQRDPSRGRTHIVIREVKYVPNESKDVRYKFKAVRAGVFRIADALTELERLMNLHKGEGTEYIRGLLADIDAADRSGQHVPILDLTFGDEVDTWLGSNAISLDMLRMVPYDPEWRKTINKSLQPQRMTLRNGAQDAEHIF